VKQVPDAKNISGEAMKADGTVDRESLPTILNPEDLHALEAALAIRDEHGGTVTVITMGLPEAGEVLREALYRGADRTILITDPRAAGSDTLSTSYIISAAMNKLDPDIVLCGRETLDGDTAHVGPQIAEQIGFTLITYVDQPVVIEKQTVTVRRSLDNGWEYVSAELPVLFTVTNTANTPRPPSVKRAMKFKKAMSRPEIEQAVTSEMKDADAKAIKAEEDKRCLELDKKGLLVRSWNLDDLGVDTARCGLVGSPTKVCRVQSITLSGSDYKQFENTDKGVADLVRVSIKDHTIG